MKIKELQAKRVEVAKQAQAMLDAADAKKEALSAEDQQIFDRMMDDVDKLEKQIERKQRLAAAQSDMDRPAPRQTSRRQPNAPATPASNQQLSRADETYRELFRHALVSPQALAAQPRAAEFLSLQTANNVEGGYLVTPEMFVTELIKAIDNLTIMRGLCRVIQLDSAQSLGAASLDADPADPTWTSEISAGNEDSTMGFGKRALTPHALAQYIKVSNKLLRVAAVGAETVVRDRLAYKFAIVEESAFLNGNGQGKPLGVFTASDLGIPTSRDVSTGNTTSSPTFDGLMEAFYSLKSQYQANATWIFHRDGLKLVRKLKDSQNQYLWQPSTVVGNPDSILGRPVMASEYAPNTFTTGLYAGIVGDFQHYWIVEALDVQIIRLNELLALTNQTGFIGRREVDAQPILGEAFTRVKLA